MANDPWIEINLSEEADVIILGCMDNIKTMRVLRQRTSMILRGIKALPFTVATRWYNPKAEELAQQLNAVGCTVYIRYGVLENAL